MWLHEGLTSPYDMQLHEAGPLEEGPLIIVGSGVGLSAVAAEGTSALVIIASGSASANAFASGNVTTDQTDVGTAVTTGGASGRGSAIYNLSGFGSADAFASAIGSQQISVAGEASATASAIGADNIERGIGIADAVATGDATQAIHAIGEPASSSAQSSGTDYTTRPDPIAWSVIALDTTAPQIVLESNSYSANPGDEFRIPFTIIGDDTIDVIATLNGEELLIQNGEVVGTASSSGTVLITATDDVGNARTVTVSLVVSSVVPPEPYPVEPLEPSTGFGSRGRIPHVDRFPGEFLTIITNEDRFEAQYLVVAKERVKASFDVFIPYEERVEGIYLASFDLIMGMQEDEDLMLVLM